MNKIISNILFTVFLIFFQAMFLNHVNFLNFINPYLYIFFIIYFPLKTNRSIFILIATFAQLFLLQETSKSTNSILEFLLAIDLSTTEITSSSVICFFLSHSFLNSRKIESKSSLLNKSTYVYLRWMVYLGQLSTVLIVKFLFEFNFNYIFCLIIIFISIITNLFFTI